MAAIPATAGTQALPDGISGWSKARWARLVETNRISFVSKFNLKFVNFFNGPWTARMW